MFGNIFGAVASAIGAWLVVWGERMRENNTPEMVKNDQARKDQEASDKITDDIRKAHQGDTRPLQQDEA